MNGGRVPLQHHMIATSFDVPEPDRLVKAATGKEPSIRAPGDSPHFVSMPCECPAHMQVSLFPHVPKLDGAIKAATGQGTSSGGKSQREHPVAMPGEQPHDSFRLRPVHL